MENRCAREIRGPARNDVMIPVDNNKQRDDVQQRARVAHDWAVNSLLLSLSPPPLADDDDAHDDSAYTNSLTAFSRFGSKNFSNQFLK